MTVFDKIDLVRTSINNSIIYVILDETNIVVSNSNNFAAF